MDLIEYKNVKDYTYEKYCNYLKDKYGVVNGNYFTPTWNKNNRISRTKDGLFIHHIKEDTAPMLSEKKSAKQHPYAYQLSTNLVYCNYLEHLFLHILINEQFNSRDYLTNCCLGTGGIFIYLVPQLNDIYSGFQSKQKWRQNCEKLIIEDKETYFELLDRIIHYIKRYPYYSASDLKQSFNSNYGLWDNKLNEGIYQFIDERIDFYENPPEDEERKIDLQKIEKNGFTATIVLIICSLLIMIMIGLAFI